MLLIEAHHLSKTFGNLTAVDDVDITVQAGEIYGLVGPDGAGKTSTLRLLVGALTPDEGDITICSFNLHKQLDLARGKIGYLSQRFSLYEDLTVLENIRFFAEVRGLDSNDWKPRSMELLKFVGLETFIHRKAGQLSGGMKQKLGLASALVTQPQVLLLDEPTTGVDPVTRQDFWHLIIQIVVKEKIAIVLTTPYMDEAARCNRLGFMHSGRIIAEGSPSQLKAPLEGHIIEIQNSNSRKLIGKVSTLPFVEDVSTFGDKIHLRSAAKADPSILQQIQEEIEGAGVTIQSIRFIPATFEDVFVSLSAHSTQLKPSSEPYE